MRVCVATAGHLSTCPRMVKVADALHGAGYEVRVVSTRSTGWATRADDQLRRSRSWTWDVVDVSRASAVWRQRWTGLRYRAARAAAARFGGGGLPRMVVAAAFSRTSAELRRALLRADADVYFGGTSGALGPVGDAAARLRRPYGVDLEDLHTDERVDEGAALHHRLAHRVLSEVLPGASLVTASSEGIATAYRNGYGVDPLVMHNVWPRTGIPAAIVPRDQPLGFYWFSQTIGPERGIEESIAAIGAADVQARLVARGSVAAEYAGALRRLAARRAPRLSLEIEGPVAPDDLGPTCSGFDVGLSTELPTVENRQQCLSNKLFMYLTGGLAVLATPTAAQRELLGPLGCHVAWLDPADPAGVAPVLRRWAAHRPSLAAAREASRDAAAARWHWEHALERGRFLERFARAFA